MERTFRYQDKQYDFVVVGGGMAGFAAAVTAARSGVRTALVQNRPVLGGNASKEIRVWLHGADGNANNGYYRETGLMEEMKLENLYWNPDGNAEPWNLILTNAAMAEPLLDLYLNTVVTEVTKNGERIESVKGFTLASETWTTFRAPYFADTTGDGTIGFLAGVPYARGREAASEYGERLAPKHYEPYTMGGTIMFLAKDTGHPIYYKRPEWAHCFTEEQLMHRSHSHKQAGIYFWWMEWGGMKDTIHDNEEVRNELCKIVYGMWDHLKNAPDHAGETRNLELEWVGVLPGKRESRRLIGPHILTEQDILTQHSFDDSVAFGGWNLDHHPAKGFWDQDSEPSFHFHIPGIYPIPLRSLYAVNVPNLFFAGRNISVTHIAMCSTRVMLTGAQMGEAVAEAVAKCLKAGSDPRDLTASHIKSIQQGLLRKDHYIPGISNEDPADLALGATLRARSVHNSSIEPLEEAVEVDVSGNGYMLKFPLTTGALEKIELLLEGEGKLSAALWASDGKGNYFPTRCLKEWEFFIGTHGERQWMSIPIGIGNANLDWHFLHVKGEGLRLYRNTYKLPGFRFLGPNSCEKTNEYSEWRRIETWGSPCMRLEPKQQAYGPEQAVNGYSRPFRQPNLWVSDVTDFSEPEWLELSWNRRQTISSIQLAFDTDLDRDLRNLWVPYSFRAMPNCVKDYTIEALVDQEWVTLASIEENYHRLRVHTFPEICTDQIRIIIKATWGAPFAGIYEVRAYR